MYRKNVEEVFETYGNSPIIIVCNNGYGLEKFKILATFEDRIRVRYSMTEVKTPVIKLYQKNKKEKSIAQSYYVLDVQNKKVIRVPLVSVYSNFPKKRGYASFPRNHKRPAITFCTRDDIELKIESTESANKVMAYKQEDNSETKPVCIKWLDILDLPETAFLLDIKGSKVQKVQQIIFLN